MRRTSPIIAAALLAAASAQAAERHFEPCPAAQQSIRYEKGAPLLYAETSHARMFLSYEPRDSRTGYIWLGLQNAGSTQFNIDERAIGAAMDGAPLEVLGLSERAGEIRRASRWRAVGAILAAGANGYAAGTAGTQRYSGNIYSNGQTASYSGTIYDPQAASAAQARANRQNAETVAAVKNMNAADAEALQARALLAQTVDPGAIVTGDVVVELPRRKSGSAATLTISVNVAGERVDAMFAEAGKCPPPPTFEAQLDALRAKLRQADASYDVRLPEVMKRVTTYESAMTHMNDAEKIQFLERLYWSTPAPANQLQSN